MMHFRGIVLFVLFPAGGARRSIRIVDSHQGAQQENNTLANSLDVSAEARDNLIPGGFRTDVFRRAHPQAGALRPESRPAAPWFRFGPRRAKVALQAAGGPGADQLPSKENRIPKLTRRDFAAAAVVLPAVAQAATPLAAEEMKRSEAAKSLPAAKQPGIALNTGTNFPMVSFGLQVYGDGEAEKLTTIALEAGYRNFFSSVLARNQKGFARAIKKSGIPREELFICGSVLSNQVRGFDDAFKLSQKGCKENMEAFSVGGIDYIDMIMLDYPGPDEESIRGQWKALEEMKTAGLTRALAVSNFSPKQLDVILADPKATVPTVNQLPYGVGLPLPRGVVEENRKRGVLVQAWSPLSRVTKVRVVNEACEEIGKKYGKSAVQVGLRWIIDTGATFTTQSKTKAHFEEDIDIFDFKLTPEEIDRLSKL